MLWRWSSSTARVINQILHQNVHGRCPIAERSGILCWNGTVGCTQTPCPEKHTNTCSAIFLQGNTHPHTGIQYYLEACANTATAHIYKFFDIQRDYSIVNHKILFENLFDDYLDQNNILGFLF